MASYNFDVHQPTLIFLAGVLPNTEQSNGTLFSPGSAETLVR